MGYVVLPTITWWKKSQDPVSKIIQSLRKITWNVKILHILLDAMDISGASNISQNKTKLNHFWPMFTFHTPWNTTKPKVFCSFQGVWNENAGQKSVICSIYNCVKSVRFRSCSGPNAVKYGPGISRIWTLFTQCTIRVLMTISRDIPPKNLCSCK